MTPRNDDLVTFSKLRAVRIEGGYTIDHLAGICGVSRNTIRKIESGVGVRPTTLSQMLKKIMGALPAKRAELEREIFEIANRAPPEPTRTSLYHEIKAMEERFAKMISQASRDDLLEFRRALGEIDMMANHKIQLLDKAKAREYQNRNHRDG